MKQPGVCDLFKMHVALSDLSQSDVSFKLERTLPCVWCDALSLAQESLVFGSKSLHGRFFPAVTSRSSRLRANQRQADQR